MDLEEGITVTKIEFFGEMCYLLIGWHKHSFEIIMYGKDKLWKGMFTQSRMSSFSKNLLMNEEEYYKSVRNCLTEKRDDYCYELKSGFFYWSRKLNDSVIIEGFLPLEVVPSPKTAQIDLIDILININNRLNQRTNATIKKFRSLRDEYTKCLKDTEDFLTLKIEMEKALCSKFLTLINMQKIKIDSYQSECTKHEP